MFYIASPLPNCHMTATLSMPKSVAMAMLSKAQTGAQLLEILDAVVDTQEDQVPMVDVELAEVADVIEEMQMPVDVDDAYILENDYDDNLEF